MWLRLVCTDSMIRAGKRYWRERRKVKSRSKQLHVSLLKISLAHAVTVMDTVREAGKGRHQGEAISVKTQKVVH